ncbi:MAG: ATPase [Massilia sp.]|nr:ATPase [Massilia sp.]
MIEYLIGVDGGGSGTRVRLARVDGTELAQGQSGPSGLAHGVNNAWDAIKDAIARAFAQAGIAPTPVSAMAIGLGLAGVHNTLWAAQFVAADPGFAALLLATDGFTTLMGAHDGAPGTIVAIGTGSVGQALLPGGEQREVGGWGFPSGDEASGAWIGLRAINHIEQVLDGRTPADAFAQAVIDACGGGREAIQLWLGQANQTSYAQLAPIVFFHAASDSTAHALLADAGREVARIAHALDPTGTLPLALCGGLGAPLRPYLPPDLLARSVAPRFDSASGALRMIALHVQALQ